jgi:hypothetical protein
VSHFLGAGHPGHSGTKRDRFICICQLGMSVDSWVLSIEFGSHLQRSFSPSTLVPGSCEPGYWLQTLLRSFSTAWLTSHICPISHECVLSAHITDADSSPETLRSLRGFLQVCACRHTMYVIRHVHRQWIRPQSNDPEIALHASVM